MAVQPDPAGGFDPEPVRLVAPDGAPTAETRYGRELPPETLAWLYELMVATRELDKFVGVAFRTGQLGLPLLEGTLASIECRVREQYPGGDHTIFVGEVIDADVGEGSPLLYYRRGYHELQ